MKIDNFAKNGISNSSAILATPFPQHEPACRMNEAAFRKR